MNRIRSAATLIVTAALLSVTFPGGVASGEPTGGVVDTFARADAPALGSAETGQPWSLWSGAAQVVSQQAELYGGYSLAVVDTGLTSGTAAVSVPVPSPEFWLVVRASDGANYWRFGRWGDGAYLLQQVVGNGLGSPPLEQLATVTPAAGDRLSCELGPTLTCSVNGTAVVRTTDPFNATARHAGLAAYSGGGGALVRFDDVVVQAPAAAPDLRVTVMAASSSAEVGGPVSWTATVANAGAGAAPAVTATLTPAAGLTGATVSSSAGTCSPTGSTWTCELGDRPAGSSATITLSGTAPPDPASLTVTVAAQSSVADADPADNSGSATVTTSAPQPTGAASASDTFSRADSSSLGVAETGQAWDVPLGAARVASQQAEATGAAYTLATLDSATATGIASVRVPAISSEYWLVVRGSSPSSYWRFGRWQSGGYVLQQIDADSLGSPALTVLASVTPAPGDRLSCSLEATLTCSVNGTALVRTDDAFNSAARSAGFAAGAGSPTRFDDFVVIPPAAPDLRVSVTGSAVVDTSAPVSWSGTVVNAGTGAATGSAVTVVTPAGLSGAQVSTSAGSCTDGAGTWTCGTGTLAAGGSLTVSVSGVAPAEATTLTLTITASAQERDLDPGTDSAGFATTVQAPVQSGPLVQDRFDRADAQSLGTAETGQVWTTRSGTARVAAQQAETAGLRFSLATLDSGTATGTAAVTVTSPSPEFWLVFRASDANNYWRFGRLQGGAYQLQQVVRKKLGNPSRTTLATVVPAAGDRLSCDQGSTITCSVNGTAVVTTSDSFNAAARHVGLAGGAVTATRFDDLSVTPPVSGAPDLKVAAQAASGSVEAGSPVSWTATVRNDGTAPATGTFVTVTPPAAMTGTTVSSPAGSCAASGGSWQCPVGTRAVGDSFAVTVQGTAPSTATTLTLTVVASSAETDLDPSTNNATSTVAVTVTGVSTVVLRDDFGRSDAPSLGNSKTGQPWATWSGTARVAGQQAEATGAGYTLAVADSGVTSGTAAITVPVVSGEFWLVARATDSANYWRFGRWQNGTYVLQQVVGNGLGSPPLTVSATVTPAPGDRLSCALGAGLSCSVNGSPVVSTTDGFNAGGRLTGFAAGSGVPTRFDDLLVTTGPPAADLGVSVVASAATAAPGAPVAWTAAVSNNGSGTATDAAADVAPPPGVTGVAVTSSAGPCSPSGGSWTCALGDHGAGTAATISVDGTAPTQTASLTLTVTATSAGSDLDPADNSASASIAVQAPSPPPAAVVDEFERPDAATLGATATGQDWIAVAGGFGVSGGAAAPSGTGSVLAAVDPGWSYGTYQVKVTAGAAANAFAVAFRVRDADNYFRVGPDGSGYYRLWKVVGGSWQGLQFNLLRANVAPRDGDVIRVVNRPDDGIFVSVNGQHVLDAGDTDLLTETRVGIGASATTVRFDSLRLDPVMSSGVTTLDTFSDPDGTRLADSLSESGTHYPWRASPGMTSSGGRLVASGYSSAWVDTTSEAADVRVDVLSGSAEAWLRFRYSETGDYYRFGHRAGGNYTVERVVGGASTPGAGSVTTSLAPQAVDVLEVRQQADGRIECYVDGVRIADFVDTTFNRRATAYGLEGGDAVFDNFTAVAE